MHPLLERQHFPGPRDQKLGLPAVAAHHLDRKPADVTELDLTLPGQRQPFIQRVLLGRRRWRDLHDLFDHLDDLPGRSGFFPARENGQAVVGHLGRVTSLADVLRPFAGCQTEMTTSRSSVISRTE